MLRSAPPELHTAWAQSTMRCKGCAAKVPPRALASLLRSLQAQYPVQGADGRAGAADGHFDDAAVLPPPPAGHVSVQTVDFVSACVDDPFLFGGIVAVHALADCYAMGAQPSAALAVVQVRGRLLRKCALRVHLWPRSPPRRCRASHPPRRRRMPASRAAPRAHLGC